MNCESKLETTDHDESQISNDVLVRIKNMKLELVTNFGNHSR